MKEKIETLKTDMLTKLSNVSDIKALNDLKVEYLGKKGIITELNTGIKDVESSQRKDYGMLVNTFRTSFNDEFDTIKVNLETDLVNKKLESETIDVSLPATSIPVGAPNIDRKSTRLNS